jgi:hypothetical protein
MRVGMLPTLFHTTFPIVFIHIKHIKYDKSYFSVHPLALSHDFDKGKVSVIVG